MYFSKLCKDCTKWVAHLLPLLSSHGEVLGILEGIITSHGRRRTVFRVSRSNTNQIVQSQKNAKNFVFKKTSNCTIPEVKTKVLFNCAAVTFV